LTLKNFKYNDKKGQPMNIHPEIQAAIILYAKGYYTSYCEYMFSDIRMIIKHISFDCISNNQILDIVSQIYHHYIISKNGNHFFHIMKDMPDQNIKEYLLTKMLSAISSSSSSLYTHLPLKVDRELKKYFHEIFNKE
jgi:hypothetical protein